MVGCLGWASAAWKITPRDRHICWTAECQRTRLHLLANNARFLILLGIQIRHLASQMLAMSVRGLSAGWTHRCGHPLYLAETFVDLVRCRDVLPCRQLVLRGTDLGLCQAGESLSLSRQVKGIYLYPLCSNFRPSHLMPDIRIG